MLLVNLLKDFSIKRVTSNQALLLKMPSSVLTASKFTADLITFGKHKPNTNGGYNIEISVGDTSDEILLQTPKMRAPFGISTDKTNIFKKSLDISFQGIESNPSVKAFRDLIEKTDEMIINYALKNSKTFFKKDLTRDVIKEYYYSGIKLSKKEQYSDTFKMKLPFLKPNPEKNYPNGKYFTTFWTHSGDEQPDTYLDKGDSVTALLKPRMLWVANRSFGITWECSQLRIHKQAKNTAYAFTKTSDSGDDSDDDHGPPPPKGKAVELISDSEEEVEVDE
jgi:hypothetical protein